MADNKWSSAWTASSKPKKQRLYVRRAPLHRQSKLVSCSLAKDLRAKHGRRTIPIRTGDKVRIMRGSHKGKTPVVASVNRAKRRVYLEGIQVTKKEGTKVNIPFAISNLQIIDVKDATRRFKQSEKKDTAGQKTKIQKAVAPTGKTPGAAKKAQVPAGTASANPIKGDTK
ncbi:50S ribosomal protein L24 [Candidatus Woesearchaeota archaeon CG_4_10_14_0_2_um_filter_57_5]|nr:MAG: 50S ribosomal protein L24 [Candidatus Woesearchaeota archaeon CG1_02_57_44]PIZ52803.1 MAG: 50S ribosomal protein L24 [Candidatus Woesearchaeota archaeon CG_4_10_14_0_2_um_filter_57_5]